MKQISFKQYRTNDIVILTIMTAFFESLLCIATNSWFVLQAMSVSITLAMTCIVAFRWGGFAVIPSFVGSMAYCITYNLISEKDLSGQQILTYCCGSVFCLIAIPLLIKLGKENVRKDFVKRSALAVIIYILIAVGRCLFALMFGENVEALSAYFTVDILSLLFAIVVLTVTKDLDGMLEDQKAYILRIDRERREEQEANTQDPFNDPY